MATHINPHYYLSQVEQTLMQFKNETVVKVIILNIIISIVQWLTMLRI